MMARGNEGLRKKSLRPVRRTSYRLTVNLAVDTFELTHPRLYAMALMVAVLAMLMEEPEAIFVPWVVPGVVPSVV